VRNGLSNLDVTTYLWLHRVQEKAILTQINRWISRSGDGYLYVAIAGLGFWLAPDTAGEPLAGRDAPILAALRMECTIDMSPPAAEAASVQSETRALAAGTVSRPGHRDPEELPAHPPMWPD